MVSFTPEELCKKAIAQQTRDGQACVMMFGLTLEELLERITFYDKHKDGVYKLVEVNDKCKVIIQRNGVVVHKDT
jgi:hypothetical protein